jgi:hypothetical protein
MWMGDTVETKSRAASILRQLALGEDPFTGALLSQDHVLHRPEVIRALMVACESLDPRHADGAPPDKAARAGMSWSDEEDSKVRELFEHGGTIGSIATSLQRSYGSIRSRLLKLELLDDFQVVLEEARDARRR